HAAEAFRQALGLAGPLGASVVVFHVARPPAVVIDGGRLLTDPGRGEPKDLWADLRKIKADGPGVAVEHEVIVADRPSASHILDILEKTGCDLIVMGTHGLTGLKHRLVGGLTEEVVRRARCPVMVVKDLAAPASDRAPEAAMKSPGVDPRKPGATPAPKEATRWGPFARRSPRPFGATGHRVRTSWSGTRAGRSSSAATPAPPTTGTWCSTTSSSPGTPPRASGSRRWRGRSATCSPSAG